MCKTILDFYLLGTVKVKLDTEVLDEGGDGVTVGVSLLLDDPDEVLHHIGTLVLVDDDCGRQVAEDPGASGLDGVQVHLLVQELLDDQVTALQKEHQLVHVCA